MKRKTMLTIAIATVALAVSGGAAVSAQDKYSLKVPGGLAMSEFRGYETWQVVSISHPAGAEDQTMSGETLHVIVANPVMIKAYADGIPGNGKPFPDGAKTAKIAYVPKKSTDAPFNTSIPDRLLGLGFMVKDSKRFADSGGWGWAQFKYDAASNRFTPWTLADNPPQGNDAKCGLACHTIAKGKDYVFMEYAQR